VNTGIPLNRQISRTGFQKQLYKSSELGIRPQISYEFTCGVFVPRLAKSVRNVFLADHWYLREKWATEKFPIETAKSEEQVIAGAAWPICLVLSVVRRLSHESRAPYSHAYPI